MLDIYSSKCGGTGSRVRNVLLVKGCGTGSKTSVLLDQCGGMGPGGRLLCIVPTNGVWRWHFLGAWLLNMRRRKRRLAFGDNTWPITRYIHTCTAHFHAG